MKAGDTFIVSYPGDEPSDLWIIATDPLVNDEIVMFRFVPVNPRVDPICIVRRGEHPEITRDVSVLYEASVIRDHNKVQAALAAGCTLGRPVSGPVLLRIQQGALDSDHTSERLKRIVRASMKAPKTTP